MKSESYEQATQSFNSFETICPIFAVGGLSAKDNWNTWKSYFLKDISLDVVNSADFRNIVKTINKDILQTWERCKLSYGLKIGITRNIDPKIFNIDMVYKPEGVQGSRTFATLRSIGFSEPVEINGYSKKIKNLRIEADGKILQIKRLNDNAINVVLEFSGAPNATRQFDLPAIKVMGECKVPRIFVKDFSVTSPAAAPYPEWACDVPPGYKILSGGVKTNWVGNGSLIFDSYPQTVTRWKVRCREHLAACASTVTVFVVALYDPEDNWDVQIFSNSSQTSILPQATVTVPDTYVMTGGGVKVLNDCTPVFKCFPVASNMWFAQAKDHGISCPGVINAYAIGIRPNNNIGLPNQVIKGTEISFGNYQSPELKASIPSDYIFVGGGGEAIFAAGQPGILLTWSYPDFKDKTWVARCKDHSYPCGGQLRSFAIGLRWTSSVAK